MRHLFGVRPAANAVRRGEAQRGDPGDRPRRPGSSSRGRGCWAREGRNSPADRPAAGGRRDHARRRAVGRRLRRPRCRRSQSRARARRLPPFPLRPCACCEPVPLRTVRDLAYWSPCPARLSLPGHRPPRDAPSVALLGTRTAEQTRTSCSRWVAPPTRAAGCGRGCGSRSCRTTRPVGCLARRSEGSPSSGRGSSSIWERLTATLYRAGKRIFSAGVGVGTPQWPTPRGEFYIRNRLASYSSPFYGPVAFGTSARSEVLTDWPAGGFVGIHGTDRARAPSRPRLARVHPHAKPGHPPTRPAVAGGDAAHHPLMSRAIAAALVLAAAALLAPASAVAQPAPNPEPALVGVPARASRRDGADLVHAGSCSRATRARRSRREKRRERSHRRVLDSGRCGAGCRCGLRGTSARREAPGLGR